MHILVSLQHTTTCLEVGSCWSQWSLSVATVNSWHIAILGARPFRNMEMWGCGDGEAWEISLHYVGSFERVSGHNYMCWIYDITWHKMLQDMCVGYDTWWYLMIHLRFMAHLSLGSPAAGTMMPIMEWMTIPHPSHVTWPQHTQTCIYICTYHIHICTYDTSIYYIVECPTTSPLKWLVC
jgi:hypothetical protein